MNNMRSMRTNEVIEQIMQAGYEVSTSQSGDARNMRIFVKKGSVSYGKVTVIDGVVKYVKWYSKHMIPDLGQIECQTSPNPLVEELVEDLRYDYPNFRRVWYDIREAYREWWAETDEEMDARDEPTGIEYFNTGLLFLFVIAAIVFLGS